MTPSEYPEHVTKEMCVLRHSKVEDDVREIKEETKRINSKLWGMMLMIVAQLFGVLTIFIKGCAA